jgi:hypothetical protein
MKSEKKSSTKHKRILISQSVARAHARISNPEFEVEVKGALWIISFFRGVLSIV